MLQLLDINHNKIAGLQNYKEYYIQREINQLDILSFLYPISDKDHDSILHECYIRTKENEYVVKEVNYSDENWDQYVCKVNIEGIQGTPVSHFETVEQKCIDSATLALAGTGWTVGNCDVTKLRTVKKNNCTAYDVLQEIQTAYNCEMTFDAINKQVNIYQAQGNDKGTYFTDQLNLKKVDVQSNSYDYITRLIPIGKDGLDISSVSGNNYVENYQYSNKIITAYWEDNRYTVAQDLYDDAVERLAYLSVPTMAYKSDIYDLANVSNTYKDILDYKLGDTITLLSKERNVKEKQRIVKLVEYPDEPERNTVEIANKIASLDALNVRFQDTSDTVDDVTTSDGYVDGSKVDGVDWDKIQHVHIAIADIENLSATIANIGNLTATEGDITILDSANAHINELVSSKASITDLQASNARIGTLEANTASISTLLNGNLTSKNMQAGIITADSGLIANGAIQDAQIANLSVAKILAGDISSTKFTIVSDSGNLKLQDNTLHIWDTNGKERISLGLNNGDYNLLVRAADGTTVMFGANGVTNAGITSGAVDDSKVAASANIQGSKLDIASVFSVMNGSSSVLKATKVQLDDQGQTLQVAFTNLTNTVSSVNNTVSNQGTSITAIQGQISSKIWQQDITNAVNGIQVGGVNLLDDSSFELGTLSLSNFSRQTGVFDGGNMTSHSGNACMYQYQTTTSSSLDSYGFLSTLITVEPQQQYMISYWAACAGGSLQSSDFIFDNNYNLVGTLNGHNTLTTDKVWRRIVCLWTCPSNVTSIRLRFGMLLLSRNGWIAIDDIKVEVGNKATDWSPAPEDVQSQINTNASNISQTLSAIGFDLSTQSFTQSGTIGSLQSTQEYINMQKGKIESAVSSADVTSAINNIQVGGTNLLRNSGAFRDTSYWSPGYSGGSGESLSLVNDPVKGNVLQWKVGAGYNWSMLLQNFRSYSTYIFANKQYTISFDAKLNTSGIVSIALCSYSSTNYLGSGNVTVGTSWDRYSIIFTPNANYINSNDTQVYITSSSGSTLWITNLKLEVGNKATDWSPAPEDVQSQIDSQESSITQLTNSISLKASQSSVDSLNSSVNSLTTRMGNAEIAIQPGNITNTVTNTITNQNMVTQIKSINPQLLYVGSNWDGLSSVDVNGVGMRYSNGGGDYIQYTFAGTGIDVYTTKSDETGIIQLYIDGVSYGTCDTYSATYVSVSKSFSVSGLSNTSHTVKLLNTGNKNANSRFSYMGFVRFDITVPDALVKASTMQSIFKQGSDSFQVAFNSITPNVALSDSGEFDIINGRLKVKNLNAEVTIDGMYMMHKIVSGGNGTLVAATGQTTASVTIPHYMGYTPCFDGYFFTASSLTAPDNLLYPIPYIDPAWDDVNGTHTIANYATMRVDSTNIYIYFKRSSAMASGGTTTLFYRYYIYKEQAI